MNGATEQTLAELLATANAMNANMVKLLKLTDEIRKNGGAGGSGGLGAAAGLASIAKAANPLSLVFSSITSIGDALGSAFSLLGGIVGHTIGAMTNVTGELVNFAVNAAKGTAKLSDFYAAFKGLPLGLGTISSIFTAIMKYAEELLGFYQKLTNAGASFSGDLFLMRGAAARAQMTMEEFSKVINENSDIFASLGSNVQNGIDKFVDIQSALMGPKSRYENNLLMLGYTSEQASNMLAGYIRSQGSLTKASLQSNDQIAASVVNVAREIDLYAKVTGASREAVEKEMKKASFDAAWKTYTERMSAEERVAAEAALAKAILEGGQGAGDMLKTMFMTNGEIVAPLTDAARDVYSTTNGAIETYTRQMYDSAMKFKSGSEEQLFAQMKARRDLADGSKAYTNQLGTTGGVLSVLNSKMAGTAEAMNSAMQVAGKTDEELRAAAKKAIADAKAQMAGPASQLITANQSIKNFGNTINELVARFIGPLAGQLSSFGNAIMNTVSAFVADDGFQNAISSISDWFYNAFVDLKSAYSAGGITGLMNEFGRLLKEGAKNVWDVVGPSLKAGFSYIWDEIRPKLIEGFVKLIDFIKPYFQEIGLAIKESVEDYLKKETRGLAGTSEEANSRRGTDTFIQTSKEMQEWLKKRQTLASESGNAELMSRYFNTRLNRDDLVKEFIEELKSKTAAAAELSQKAQVYVPGRRDLGTFGMTGKTSEPADTNVNIEKGERVLNPFETANYNNQGEALNQLNNLTAQLLQAQREANELSRRQLSATKGLSGNLFA
jgi:hypothetical protein